MYLKQDFLFCQEGDTKYMVHYRDNIPVKVTRPLMKVISCGQKGAMWT